MPQGKLDAASGTMLMSGKINGEIRNGMVVTRELVFACGERSFIEDVIPAKARYAFCEPQHGFPLSRE